MYVSSEFRLKTAQELDETISRLDKHDYSWTSILMLDYYYHHKELNYDGGLSFFDRIKSRLGDIHPEWDIEGLKQAVRNSKKPREVYKNIVGYLLEDPYDLFRYGF